MIEKFIRHESFGGFCLAGAALLALALANSPFLPLYHQFQSIPVAFQVGFFELKKPLILWINDGLMALFFLLVGLEIKREMIRGQLSSRHKALLPGLAAVGGLVCPALFYTMLNWGDPSAMRGWAIPAATDIAFALGVLTLLGKRIPDGLKICLLAIAIIDDLMAIVIIALFYTDQLSLLALGLAGGAVCALAYLNWTGKTHKSLYIFTGILLWIFVLKSGVHATLAGVVLAFFIPLHVKNDQPPPLIEMENGLHKWVAFIVLPLFAFANAGVNLGGISHHQLFSPICFGIIGGLFIGKQIGVMGATWLSCKFNLCQLPKGVSWTQYYGMTLLTGIGFTMSLFIGTLAFEPERQDVIRLGVLIGSALSGLTGYFFLRRTVVLKCSSPKDSSESSCS